MYVAAMGFEKYTVLRNFTKEI